MDPAFHALADFLLRIHTEYCFFVPLNSTSVSLAQSWKRLSPTSLMLLGNDTLLIFLQSLNAVYSISFTSSIKRSYVVTQLRTFIREFADKVDWDCIFEFQNIILPKTAVGLRDKLPENHDFGT